MRLVLIFSLVLLFFQNSFSFHTEDSLKIITPGKEHQKQSALISAILQQFHYNQTSLNDSISSLVFDNYFQNLDGYKLYFLEQDYKYFEEYRYLIDDYVQRGDVDFAFQVYRLFQRRFFNRMDKIDGTLSTGFDFTLNEYLETDSDKKTWAKNKQELDNSWRKMLKYQVLNLKLNGKTHEEACKTITKRYERYQKSVLQYNSEDIFQMYMNALTAAFDPHTSYFSPHNADNFEIDMSLSLEGIGARLTSENDYVTLSEIIPGGPAFKSKRLFASDRIVGVAQGKKSDFVDIVGWRVDDAVQLIRGPKGSIVRLQILSANASPSTSPTIVELTREKIRLEDEAAEKEIIKVEQGDEELNIGIIYLPSFYRDFEAIQKGEKDYKSTTKDVKKLIEELQESNIDGLVIDLRRNGGGSLSEAISLTGLFITNGPIVQVKNTSGEIEIAEDPDPSIAYDGPLAVLIDRNSASASEIFAGAIQDYKRGVIIGETSFGKGTVQNLISLERFLPKEKKRLGQLKLTLAKYYRITGSSTQHQGVTPDIMLPSLLAPGEYGESSQPNALPWDNISPAHFKGTGQISEKTLDKLNYQFSERASNEYKLREFAENILEIKHKMEESKISLNEEIRRSKIGEDKQDDLSEEKNNIGNAQNQNFEYTKDIYLNQATKILADLINDIG